MCIAAEVSDADYVRSLDRIRSSHTWPQVERFGYREYLKKFPRQPLTQLNRFSLPRQPLASPVAAADFAPVVPITKVLVLAETAIYEKLKAEIDRYAADLQAAYGCAVVLTTMSGGTAPDLKRLIQDNRTDLSGVVAVGQLPICYFNYAYDSGYESDLDFICDYYFMDLDGNWIDSDNNGVFDDHRDGSGDVTPEVFFARIDPAKCSAFGSEEELMRIYFDKNHAYWTGEMPLGRKALAYVTTDWTMYGIGNNLSIYGEGSTDIMYQTDGADNPVSADDFLQNRIPNPEYSYINQWIHSGPEAMAIYGNGGGTITALQVEAAKPQAFVYNLMSCHSCQFVNNFNYCIGDAYVFNSEEGSRGLTCLGPTKSAGMCRQEKYWEPYISQNYTMGQAFDVYMNQWAKTGDRFEQTAIDWAYCVTIIGDPLVMLTGVPHENISDTRRIVDSRYSEGHVSVALEGTRIMYAIAARGDAEQTVTIGLYDVRGTRVGQTMSVRSVSGKCSLDLRTNFGAASGMYVCRVSADGVKQNVPVFLR
jgi:hypothetical protein